MFVVLNGIALLLCAFAAYVAVMNWRCVYLSRRNRKQGIDKYHSTIPLISFFLVVFAGLFAANPSGALVQRIIRVAWLIPALDIANWVVITALPLLALHYFKERTRKH
jgi:hypothetical protein